MGVETAFELWFSAATLGTEAVAVAAPPPAAFTAQDVADGVASELIAFIELAADTGLFVVVVVVTELGSAGGTLEAFADFALEAEGILHGQQLKQE